MEFKNSLDYARFLDEQDDLRAYRERYYIPEKDGKPYIYFCGNSLGLQPKATASYIEQELKDWQNLGVEGHFHGKNPWFYYHRFLKEQTAHIVGAKEEEVTVMNALSVNLNLLMVSFYRPDKQRRKILIDANAFPSDYYAVEQQINFHGHDPADCLIELQAEPNKHTHSTDIILNQINSLGDELALVMIGGVNYYTGQYFNLEAITKAGHAVGAQVGFDLAHAAGNVILKLHDWDIDFATWCSYKYLNSSPGGVSGIFVHEKHANKPELPRFAGWWGNDEKTRFKMERHFVPASGSDGWQMSNAPVLAMAAHRAALDIFLEVGMEKLRSKSEKLTGFLEFLIDEANKEHDLGFELITPRDPEQRGCQLSLLTGDNGKMLFDKLTEAGVIADWREPNVIRVAPVPMYNTFEEVYQFVEILKNNA